MSVCHFLKAPDELCGVGNAESSVRSHQFKRFEGMFSYTAKDLKWVNKEEEDDTT